MLDQKVTHANAHRGWNEESSEAVYLSEWENRAEFGFANVFFNKMLVPRSLEGTAQVWRWPLPFAFKELSSDQHWIFIKKCGILSSDFMVMPFCIT